MEHLAGTSGFSYAEWKGIFYPEDIAPGDMLSYYAGQLPTVEINNTFYRMPKKHVIEQWGAAVGDDFRFTIKASKRITHQAKLVDVDENIAFLLGNLEALGDKLGSVLFQTPPWLPADLDVLDTFLKLLPEGFPACFEFRNASWRVPEVAERLSARNMPMVISEDDKADWKQHPLPETSWGYLRLRRSDYDDKRLAHWRAFANEQRWERCLTYFKHEDEAGGPKLARRWLAM